MPNIRHILCPVDFSDASLRALRQAVALARAQHADVKALHVLPGHLPPLSGLAVSAAGFLEKGARETQRVEDFQQRLEEFVAAVKDGVPVEAVVEEGGVVSEIVKQADARDVDLVVMGTHGQSGFENRTLGSTTEKALRKVRRPVLTVPPGVPEAATTTSHGSFRNIVCAVDFSPSAQHALESALALAKGGEGQLVLVHVVESAPVPEQPALAGFDASGYRRALEEDARGKLRTLRPADSNGRRIVEDVRTGKAHDEILKAADQYGADLIAMGVHGHGALERALFGSTAYHVARRATCPVLTARAA